MANDSIYFFFLIGLCSPSGLMSNDYERSSKYSERYQSDGQTPGLRSGCLLIRPIEIIRNLFRLSLFHDTHFLVSQATHKYKWKTIILIELDTISQNINLPHLYVSYRNINIRIIFKSENLPICFVILLV